MVSWCKENSILHFWTKTWYMTSVVHPHVIHSFALTCRWSLWNVRTEDHKWSQQSRTWEDKHGTDRQISATHLWGQLQVSLLSWQLNTGVTADSFQCTAELLRRTSVWSRRQVNNTLIMWNLRAAMGWKISLSLTFFSCRLCQVKRLGLERRKSSLRYYPITGHWL